MVLLKANADNQLAIIAGKVVLSGGCTDVIGGTMTAGAMTNSCLLTFAPAFVSAPIMIGSVMAGIGGGGAAMTGSNFTIGFTGVTVSNAYVMVPADSSSGTVISVAAIGLAKL